MDEKTFAAVAKDIDEHAKKYVDRLRDAVAIPSVSAEPEHRKDVQRMMEWTKKHLEAVGAKVELADIGMQTLPNGKDIKLPTVLFGVLGNDELKKTLLIYGHVDVQPANKEDGWNTDPFRLTEKDGKLYGRGSSDDKGPVIGWINALETLRRKKVTLPVNIKDGKLYGRGSSDDKGPVIGWINALETLRRKKVTLPVNIKFCFEGMEESGSKGLEEALSARKDTWLSDVDFTCICDTAWLGKKPCLQYGLRGICYYFITISSSKQDLHSGDFGGVIYEPMKDLCWMLSQLTDLDGKINIEGLSEMVRPLTDEERRLYDEIDFDPVGSQGICYYFITISSSKQDLHSGDFGGVIYEPMKDLCWMLSQLTDLDGKINIEGLSEMVRPLTDEERRLYDEIDFDPVGSQGICYYFITISSSKQDLHSGDFGGVIYEPMKDLCWMLSQLTDLDGKINIEGLSEMVRPLTDEERRLYDEIDFDPEEFKSNICVPELTVKTKQEILISRWRNPSLSVHGVEGAFSGAGAKTVIPAKVVGKFSIRLVPDMDPVEVNRIVIAHLDNLWRQRGSPNHYKTTVCHSGKPWISDHCNPHYSVAAKAIKRVFNVDPDYTREGGAIPVTLTLQELTGKSVLLLPFGRSDDMAHSQNEKIEVRNFIEGTKVMATYLTELGSI
ncbi:Cytosolic non-specific dipeptidase [Toxocara canis]|uniref:Cytosolic non-specific dipeptidase n=1 Tax=Toxocara canis TaxID=6265 RepID=A0A0B2V7K8_TOXCA|nr:Cytosolic non-specific dipeptidase [Toxocara canis]